VSYLQIPDSIKTLELSNSIVWFDDGILYSRYKEGAYVNASREKMEEDVVKLKEFVGNKKVLMIAESHPQAESPRREDRDYISERLSEIIQALAILTPSAVSRMVVNLFFLFKPDSFPTTMFQRVPEAKNWLQTIKKNGPVIPVF
jgi:hypothetical protein